MVVVVVSPFVLDNDDDKEDRSRALGVGVVVSLSVKLCCDPVLTASVSAGAVLRCIRGLCDEVVSMGGGFTAATDR